MRSVLLRAADLCKTFDGKGSGNLVLNHVNLDIYSDDFTVIMGSSGAGKSTLLYSLSGMDAISGGRVEFRDGEKLLELGGLSEKQMARLRAEKFGFVFQQTHLAANLTIEENILVAGFNSGKYAEAAVRTRTEKLLRQMHIEKIAGHLPSQTSGGEAQRAAIARALVNSPDILFADEPTGALNRANTVEILNIFSELHAGGQSILMVTHDRSAALRGTRLIYIEDGNAAGELRLPVYAEENRAERETWVSNWLKQMEW